MIKILLVSNIYPSKKNVGHGIFVKNFEENLKSEGFHFSCKAVMKGISFNIFIQFLKYIILYFEILIKGFFCFYDVIYVHYISHTTFGVLLVSLLKKKSIIFNVHGTDLLSNNLLNRFSKIGIIYLIKINRVKAFVVPSPYFKERLQDFFIFPSEKIIVSPSGGINLEIFSKNENLLKDNPGNNIFTIGYVSRIESNKGWQLFISLVSALKTNGIKLNAIIVGKGSQEKEMQREIVKLNLKEQITYFGVLSHHELAVIYNSMDLFIFPTMADESLGLVGLEAMACGKAIVGSNIAGINSYVNDKVNGFLFEKGNIDDLLEKTLLYYNLTNNLKEEMQNNAIQTARNYSNIKVSKDLEISLKNLFR